MKTPIQVFVSIALLLRIKTNAFTSPPLAKPGSLKVSHSRPCCSPPPPLVAVVDESRQENGKDDEPVKSMEAGASNCRRRFLLASLPSVASSLAVTAAAVHVSSLLPVKALAMDEPTNKRTKILVLGGTGLVGAQVVRTLQELGIETISTSRDGRDGTVALDFVTAEDGSSTAAILLDQLSKVASGCTAVISCVGTIGTPNDFQVNAGTALAAQAAKSVGVERFVYISAAPEVKEFARDIEFLQDYMKGKTVSREAVLKFFPPSSSSSSTLIEPTFIYGGGSFNVNPPRVAGFYGNVIEGLLSSSPIRSVERILSPGIIKIALEPPVSVESVASAAVAGALGKSALPILDSYDKIKQAASSLQQI